MTLDIRTDPIEALYREPGKAEIVNGKVIRMAPTGGGPGMEGDLIAFSLHTYARKVNRGRGIGDNKGFRVDLPNRGSFSPDAAYWIGPDPGLKFYEGAPIFAVEVRSENDYGPAAEQAIAEKRMDYFAAGTLVVWDVDLMGSDVVRCYRADDPLTPIIFRRGGDCRRRTGGAGVANASG